MRRHSRAGGKSPNAQAPKAVARKRRIAPKAGHPRRTSTAKLETEVARLTRERDELLEQQTATSEVLQVISSSPSDLQPVFQTILEKAVRICDAKFGNIYRWDGETFRLLAAHNTPSAFAEARRRSPLQPNPDTLAGRLVATKTVIHVTDARLEQHVPEIASALKFGGVRTLLVVPMLKDNDLIGAFTVYRQEARPFTDKQIELVQNFAAQAVIAIENTRLLNELRQRTADLTERTADLTEALEQQTATSDVLQVISGSPGDLQPVFAAMLDKAARICDANFGNIFRWDGDALWLVATHNTPPAFAEHRGRVPFRPNQGNPIGDMLKANAAIHVADLAADERYIQQSDPEVAAAVELGGIRTFVAVPMMKDGKLIGAVILYRQEVRPFTEKQIELVKNFAAQAVIAIENARLLNELRQRTTDLSEALEQQTATSGVLQVISSSPGTLEPVFATILENAARICDAKFGNVYLWDSDAFQLVATHNTPPAFAESRKRGPFRPGPRHPFSRLVVTKQMFHVDDLAALPGYAERDPQIVAPVEYGPVSASRC
jgi:GAF domain-containing protein